MVVDQGLSDISNALIYSAMVAYTISFLGFVTDLAGRGKNIQRVDVAVPVSVGGGSSEAPPADPQPPAAPSRSRALGIAIATTYVAFALHLGGVIARGLSVHRAPWGNMYEFSISGTLVVTAVFMFVV